MLLGKATSPWYLWHLWMPALLGSIAFWPSTALACDSVRTPSDFLECVLQRNPEIVSVRAEAASAEDFKAQSARWPNPEIEGEHLLGQTQGENQYEHKIVLLQTFQLGGKRGARVDTASARSQKVGADQDQQIASALGQGLAGLLRSFQVKEELFAVDAAIAAYRRMLGNLGRRSILSPEQRSTLQLFQANLETLEDSQALLFSEQRVLRATLATEMPGINVDWSAIERFAISDWPELSSAIDNANLEGSPALKAAAAFRDLAQAEYESNRAEAWPDLKLGPMIQFEGDGPDQSQTYGLGFSIGLPIWDARGPAKRATRRLIDASRLTFETRRTQQELLFKERHGAYQSLRERILDRSARESFERYIGSVESQYARGVLGPTQVIEVYRQRIEGLRSRFEIERSALNLLLEIWTSLGELPEQTLAWTRSSWQITPSK